MLGAAMKLSWSGCKIWWHQPLCPVHPWVAPLLLAFSNSTRHVLTRNFTLAFLPPIQLSPPKYVKHLHIQLQLVSSHNPSSSHLLSSNCCSEPPKVLKICLSLMNMLLPGMVDPSCTYEGATICSNFRCFMSHCLFLTFFCWGSHSHPAWLHNPPNP